jgi:hypothetical protein
MATYEQVTADGVAGNVDGQNVYKLTFGVNDCSDIPQLQAWDDFNLDSVAGESLAGTEHNDNESLVAAQHTTNASSGAAWVPANASAGGGEVVPGHGRANRLRGLESYLLLADPGDSPPAAGDERKFQLAFGVVDDSVVGSSGHMPVLAVKTFYAGAPPTVVLAYNRGTDASPLWEPMITSPKGTPMAIGVKNTIHATGPLSTTTAPDPVTKPGSGEAWAAEQWMQTAL